MLASTASGQILPRPHGWSREPCSLPPRSGTCPPNDCGGISLNLPCTGAHRLPPRRRCGWQRPWQEVIVLTVDHYYTHTLIGDERAALDRLPAHNPTVAGSSLRPAMYPFTSGEPSGRGSAAPPDMSPGRMRLPARVVNSVALRVSSFRARRRGVAGTTTMRSRAILSGTTRHSQGGNLPPAPLPIANARGKTTARPPAPVPQRSASDSSTAPPPPQSSPGGGTMSGALPSFLDIVS